MCHTDQVVEGNDIGFILLAESDKTFVQLYIHSITYYAILSIARIVLLNLSVLGFSFVFHDKAKRTQQENLLQIALTVFLRFVYLHKQINIPM